jgi:hypothetical protein
VHPRSRRAGLRRADAARVLGAGASHRRSVQAVPGRAWPGPQRVCARRAGLRRIRCAGGGALRARLCAGLATCSHPAAASGRRAGYQSGAAPRAPPPGRAGAPGAGRYTGVRCPRPRGLPTAWPRARAGSCTCSRVAAHPPRARTGRIARAPVRGSRLRAARRRRGDLGPGGRALRGRRRLPLRQPVLVLRPHDEYWE